MNASTAKPFLHSPLPKAFWGLYIDNRLERQETSRYWVTIGIVEDDGDEVSAWPRNQTLP